MTVNFIRAPFVFVVAQSKKDHLALSVFPIAIAASRRLDEVGQKAQIAINNGEINVYSGFD
jgi:hypothetical protein